MKVIAHQTFECPQCGKKRFCDDCNICEACGFAPPEVDGVCKECGRFYGDGIGQHRRTCSITRKAVAS
jgi:hypothetical protein